MSFRLKSLIVLGISATLVSVVVLSLGWLAVASGETVFMIAALLVLSIAVLGGAPILFKAAKSLLLQRKVTASRLSSLERKYGLLNEVTRSPVTNIDEERSKPVGGGAADVGLLLSGFYKATHESGIDLTEYFGPREASMVVQNLIRSGLLLETLPWLRTSDELLDFLSLNELRALNKYFRRTGYMDISTSLIRHIADTYGKSSDKLAAEVAASELRLYRGEISIDIRPAASDWSPNRNTAVHLGGKVLPHTQTGYTLRTHYTARAQNEIGLNPIVVRHVGGDESPHPRTETYELDGITYYTLGGSKRGTVPWDEWLRSNVDRFAEVVQLARPAVIHVHSDFINYLIAKPVAKAFGIPLVNEVRGFWEETWLSRTANAEQWRDLRKIENLYGLPDMYALRRRQEALARHGADIVVTLADVMQRHIEATASELELPSAPIVVVPNAVDSNEFSLPPREDEPNQNGYAGESSASLTVGYIGSIVDYEGVDVLVKAWYVLQTALRLLCNFEEFGEVTADKLRGVLLEADLRAELSPDDSVLERVIAHAEKLLGVDARLLIVGGGPDFASIKSMAERIQPGSLEMIGRVPHESVKNYYRDIDLIILPRKRSSVTELVTPLKPFEAMAAGVPCRASDLEPLREVFDGSGTGNTFPAEDVVALAAEIASSLASPDQLKDESERCAEWVRLERSWSKNAFSYSDIYSDLTNLVSLASTATATRRLMDSGVVVTDAIAELKERPVPALDGWFSLGARAEGDGVIATAESIMTEGWEFKTFPRFELTGAIDWITPETVNRTWGFAVHSWRFMSPLLDAYVRTNDARFLKVAISCAQSWQQHVESQNVAEMAWYDMSLSLRSARVLRLLMLTVQSEHTEDVPDLLLLAMLHQEALMRPEAFNANNNHGLYCAVAEIELGFNLKMLPGMSELYQQGQDRLSEMVDRQFASDGGHLEHSPDYHRMLLASFEDVIQSGLIESQAIRNRIRDAAHVLGWLVQPDGYYVQIGDTPHRQATLGPFVTDPNSQFIISDGKCGEPATSELHVLEEAGYAFVRSPQPDEEGQRIQSSYLSFQGGFHSRAHKHADCLSFTWFDHTKEILVDSGRFGYAELLPDDSPDRLKGFYYGTPERQYVESTVAHNTVSVDGRDIERRFRKPYGSAIEQAAHESGTFRINARAEHPTYLHHRSLALTPHERLIVVDKIKPLDTCAQAVSWFNVNGDFALDVKGEIIRITGDGLRQPLWVRSTGTLVAPVKGEVNPLRGWRSKMDRTTEPVWNFGFSGQISDGLKLTTEFLFSDDNPF